MRVGGDASGGPLGWAMLVMALFVLVMVLEGFGILSTPPTRWAYMAVMNQVLPH